MQIASFKCPICGGPLEGPKKEFLLKRLEYICKNKACRTVLIQSYNVEKSEYSDKISLYATELNKNKIWVKHGGKAHTAQEWQLIAEGGDVPEIAENEVNPVAAITNDKAEEEEKKHDTIAEILKILGWLNIIGGIVLFFILLPGRPEAGYRWLFPKYIPAITWLFSGLISGVVFFALARIIDYSKQASNQLSRLLKNTIYLNKNTDISIQSKIQGE